MALASVSYGQDSNTAESIVDGLSRLAEMHEQGLLDDEEFNAAKRQLLGLSSTAQSNALGPPQEGLQEGSAWDFGQDDTSSATQSNSNIAADQGVETINYPDGSVYVGEVRNGQRNGQGTYTFVNGDVYVGEFRDNQRNGQGTFTFISGNVYVGEYRDGQRNGQGTYTSAWGRVQNGTWRNGEFVRPSVSSNNRNSSSPANQASTSNANQNQSSGNERTESLCTSYGFTPNTDAHANCVMNIDTQQRAANNEASRRAAQSLFNLGTGLINGSGNRSTTSRCRLIGDTSGQIYTFSRIGCPVGYVPAL
jgi:hypothetical protein